MNSQTDINKRLLAYRKNLPGYCFMCGDKITDVGDDLRAELKLKAKNGGLLTRLEKLFAEKKICEYCAFNDEK